MLACRGGAMRLVRGTAHLAAGPRPAPCRSVAAAAGGGLEPPDVRKLAQMAHIDITDEEVADWEPKIKKIVGWFDQLQAIDVEGVPPATDAGVDGFAALRPDTPVPSDDMGAALGQAPTREGPYIKVPKILAASPRPGSTPASPMASPTSRGDTGERDAVAALARCGVEPTVSAIVQRIPDEADCILLGEGTHGTHEFYKLRADVTAELVRSKGVVAVLVEGDWPPAFRANAYALGYGSDPDAGAALADFQARFPAWMWHNRETAAFLEGLRAHNAALPPNTRAGFLGVDMYALFQSAAQVIRYLEAVGDADAARRARRRYACFTMVAGSEADAMHYAYGLAAGARGCEQQAVDQLVETLQRAASARPDAGAPDRMRAEQAFSAAANARAVASAESYYRAMVEPSSGRDVTWNLRDSHFLSVAEDVMQHARTTLGVARPRIAVWAHNSHIGRADATDACRRGQTNLGNLLTKRFGRERVFCIGQTTSTGTVAAAMRWGGPTLHRALLPARPGSYEHVFSQACQGAGKPALCWVTAEPEVASALATPRRTRCVGVIYVSDPAREVPAHYMAARLADAYDMVVHIHETRAVTPLGAPAGWEHAVVSAEEAAGYETD